ncbi:MAG: phenylalanine--tRNA ligase subunit beta [Candidatus Aenigmatarchaeota archaeon]
MAVITIDRKDFCQLVGKEFTMREIEENIPMMGVGWEGVHGDTFDVEVFPNRPDMLSVEGIARAFSSYMGVKTGLRRYKIEASEEMVIIEDKVAKVRPYFVSCIIKNVKFTDDFIRSVMQLQEKLHLTHCRKRKKVAIGLHDYKKIIFPVIYTTKPKNFSFVPLDQKEKMTLEEILEKHPKGKEYSWILEGMDEYPILHDARGRVLSMPPIINSEDTKIDETTKDIFVDITATDEKAANEVLNIIVTTFAERGAKIHKIKIKYGNEIIYTPNLSPSSIQINPNYVNKLLGLKLSNKEIIEYLKMMGHDAEEIGKERIEVLVPCYRADIMHPMDIVEDVAIAYGYQKFEPEIPNISTIGEEDEKEILANRLRSLLVGYGFQEVVTFILTNKSNLFKKMNMEERKVAETENAKTSEYNVVRSWLLPSLLEVLSRNKHNDYPQNLFEVGDVFVLDGEEGRTMKRLAITLCHSRTNFSEIKSVFESILSNLGIDNYRIEESSAPCYIKGRAAKFLVDGKVLARFGEINPIVLERWGLEMPVAGGEICADLLFELVNKIKSSGFNKDDINLKEKQDDFEDVETVELFYKDPYLRECKSKVLEIKGREVVLDRTIFFAFSGGQASDTGTIDGIRVVDVKKENGKIVHVLEVEPTFSIGNEVELKLDWERRYRIMKLHSAAHIVYYPLIEKTGNPTVIGSNVSSDKARIDILYDKPLTPIIKELEEEVNSVISRKLEIRTEDDNKVEGKRWWKCGDWNMPCGGTHVRNTSEIGLIKLKRKNIGAGKERVEIELE